jgi:hypothetical protein
MVYHERRKIKIIRCLQISHDSKFQNSIEDQIQEEKGINDQKNLAEKNDALIIQENARV